MANGTSKSAWKKMSNRKNDIERYLRGEMTAAEMHALEKEALRDPFLAEALEGVDQAGSHDKFLFDLNELHKSVRQRTKARRGKVISITRWSYGIAAGLILLALSSVYIISLIQSKESRQLAEEVPSSKDMEVQKDSTVADSSVTKELLTYDDNRADQQSESQETESATESDDPNSEVPLSEVGQEETVNREAERVVMADLTEYPPVYDTITHTDEIADLALPPVQQTLSGRASGVVVSNLVRGKVVSAEDGLGLPGVNVLIKGTSTGTVTDVNGDFELVTNDPNQTLVFSFIGLKALEMSIADRKELNVKMSADAMQLSEVVATGYSGSDTESHTIVQFAEPSGGRQQFRKYLAERMIYPAEAKEKKIEGRVTVQFSVDEQGNLGDFKVLRSLGYGCDEELIRLIKEGPKWTPAKRGDQPFKNNVRVRLRFSLRR
jgi:TonB family protein